MQRFYYKVLEGNRSPNRRKMLIVAPDANGTYHAFVEDMADIFVIKHLEYDNSIDIDANLRRLADEISELYGDDCSEWCYVDTKSPLEELK